MKALRVGLLLVNYLREYQLSHGVARADAYDKGDYRPSPVKGKTIGKPQGGERLLGIPNTHDRVIQLAVSQHLTTLWDTGFSEHSYGFRPGRSNLDAVRAVKAFVVSGKTWINEHTVVAAVSGGQASRMPGDLSVGQRAFGRHDPGRFCHCALKGGLCATFVGKTSCMETIGVS